MLAIVTMNMVIVLNLEAGVYLSQLSLPLLNFQRVFTPQKSRKCSKSGLDLLLCQLPGLKKVTEKVLIRKIKLLAFW